MPSQVELLRQKVERLEPEYGKDDPYVKALKQQLASFESQVARKQRPNPVTLSVSMQRKG